MFISISKMFIFAFFFFVSSFLHLRLLFNAKIYYLKFFERAMNYQETLNPSFFLKKLPESRVRPKFIW